MAQFPPAPLPPACAECVSMLQLAGGGASPVQSAWKMVRAGDGKTRVDYGNTSVITDPATRKAIVLDHVLKEAHVLPLPQPVLPQAAMPGVPSIQIPGTAGAVAPMNVQDLGKQMIEGEEAEGKKYIFAHVPSMPVSPNLPGAPAMPGLPNAPSAPGFSNPAQTVTEMWTNTRLQLPVLTKVTGPFGQQTCQCRNVAAPEPSPALFQIPPGYKTAGAPGV